MAEELPADRRPRQQACNGADPAVLLGAASQPSQTTGSAEKGLKFLDMARGAFGSGSSSLPAGGGSCWIAREPSPPPPRPPRPRNGHWKKCSPRPLHRRGGKSPLCIWRLGIKHAGDLKAKRRSLSCQAPGAGTGRGPGNRSGRSHGSEGQAQEAGGLARRGLELPEGFAEKAGRAAANPPSRRYRFKPCTGPFSAGSQAGRQAGSLFLHEDGLKSTGLKRVRYLE